MQGSDNVVVFQGEREREREREEREERAGASESECQGERKKEKEREGGEHCCETNESVRSLSSSSETDLRQKSPSSTSAEFEDRLFTA